MSGEPSRVPPGPTVSRKFATLARSGTKPEAALRRELHARGRRYRVQYRVAGLPRRTIDIAFTRQRLAIMVDGCFWHGCPQHLVPPSRNSDWWAWKVSGNRARDRDTNERLTGMGWRVLRIWEHEGVSDAADRVDRELGSAR